MCVPRVEGGGKRVGGVHTPRTESVVVVEGCVCVCVCILLGGGGVGGGVVATCHT